MINTVPDIYSEFISKLNLNNDSGKKLISFAVKIKKINLETLINLFINSERLFYWKQPSENFEFLAVNSVEIITANGFERTTLTETKFKSFQPDFLSNHKDFPGVVFPLFTGGLKFAPDQKEILWKDFEDSDWFIPEFLIFRKEDSFYLLFNSLAEKTDAVENRKKISEFLLKIENLNGRSNEIPSTGITTSVSDENDLKAKSEWIKSINNILSTIRQSEIKKVVLSRKVTLSLEGNISFSEIADILSRKYPGCFIFIYKSGESVFFGASPERLAKFTNGWMESDALAGSIKRGKNQKEDRKLEEELLNSQKNLAEQNAVVEFIANSFAHFSDEIIYPEKPVIRKLPNIQHLWTPVKARLNREKTMFRIIREIHPTPAICGTPWMAALGKIKELETFERGLFAGVIGWFNFDCEAEFAVAIRSGLYKRNKVYAFAGCGIVEGSDPIVEYKEAQLKLRPVLSLFENEKISQS